MKHFNNNILEAVNKGIKLALDDFEDDDLKQTSSKSDIVKNDELIKKRIDFDHCFVDLGLPSGTLWAKYNLGVDIKTIQKSKNPKDWYGNFYAWGEITPKEEYSAETHKYGCYGYATKYVGTATVYAGTPTNVGTHVLDLSDDAAYQANHNTRIPSKKHFEELCNYTKNKFVVDYNGINGLNGRLITSTINENQIFLPCAGYMEDKHRNNFCSIYFGPRQGFLWMSDGGNSVFARDLEFTDELFDIKDLSQRYYGFNIRPIMINE